MNAWDLFFAGYEKTFLDLEDCMNDNGCEGLIEKMIERLEDGDSQFGILLVIWQNSMGHAMVIESKSSPFSDRVKK